MNMIYHMMKYSELKMIDYISKHQTTKIICLIELPYLSKEIK